MQGDPSWITAEQLIAYARDHGHHVTDAQRRRYHHAGVLPSPKMVGLGRGRGRVALYPAGSERQLVRLQELLAQDRSAERARFQLWLERFPVATHWICAYLRQTLGQMDDLVAEHSDDTLDGPNERVDQLLELASTGRLSSPVLGAARRRLGREAFATIPALLMDLLAGYSTEWGGTESRDIALATRVNQDFVSDALQAVRERLTLTNVKDAIETTTDEDLHQARDEYSVFGGLIRETAVALQRESVRGSSKNPSTTPIEQAVAFLGRLLEGSSSDPALLFSLWLAVRRQPSWQAAIDLITNPMTRPAGTRRLSNSKAPRGCCNSPRGAAHGTGGSACAPSLPRPSPPNTRSSPSPGTASPSASNAATYT